MRYQLNVSCGEDGIWVIIIHSGKFGTSATQALRFNDIPFMARDAIELLTGEKNAELDIHVKVSKDDATPGPGRLRTLLDMSPFWRFPHLIRKR